MDKRQHWLLLDLNLRLPLLSARKVSILSNNSADFIPRRVLLNDVREDGLVDPFEEKVSRCLLIELLLLQIVVNSALLMVNFDRVAPFRLEIHF